MHLQKGGFNMVNIKDFFHALKNNWVRRYIQGLDNHWADINKRIDSELPSLSRFFKSYKILNNFFWK